MASCELCDRWFRNDHARNQHGRAVHCPCPYCDRLFWNCSDLQDHDDEEHSWECDYCNQVFAYRSGCNDHEYDEHNVCKTCKKQFGSWGSLQQHVNSGVHEQRTTTCPFCSQSFRTMSAMTQHIENGNCPKNRVTRHDVKQFVRQREAQLGIQGTLLTPRLTYGNHANVPAKATRASWNGDAFECCICSREFAQLDWLNSHLISHEPKDYRCAACDRRFNVLSAVIQHWELSQCGRVVSSAARELAKFRITL